ncbi:MAG: aminotransferase class I/II-fold pyridoxal phosphate-dependent enzyme, partial [Saprospiraceae bacterium]|nr:aminotransferase class I/II-fold pyridoxal phosphate-dependent enzyme [Saprospiraceae bacterium]
MFDPSPLVRPNIQNLQPYSSARDEFAGTAGIFLDANENPFGRLNRYPDPHQQALKNRLAALKQVPADQIFIGNGSDEVLDLCFRVFCTPTADRALTFSPSYGMYAVLAGLNDVVLTQLPLGPGFQIDWPAMEPQLADPRLKIVLLCSPNNPTGNCIDGIERLLERFGGIVVVDEAYIDFARRPSCASWIERFPRLIVVQTLSKAWGLAAARVGLAIAHPAIIRLLDRAKPPYNVSALNQQAALQALERPETFEQQIKILLQQRAWLEQQLRALPIVRRVYPSEANFLLVEVAD